MEKPRFKANLRVYVSPPDDIIALGEIGHNFHKNAALAKISPWLDGKHDMDEIMRLAGNTVFPPELWYAVMQGQQLGYLQDAALDGAAEPGALAFWDSLGVAATVADGRLAQTRVAVATLGGLEDSTVVAALKTAGFSTVDAGQDHDLLLVCTDDYLRPELQAINRRQLDHGLPWMLARPVGVQPWIGPILLPSQTGCWACLADRIRRNRELELFVESKAGKPSYVLAPPVATASTQSLGLHFACLELLRWLAKPGQDTLEGRVLTYAVAKGALVSHELQRRPQCACCGSSAPLPEVAPRLVERPRMPAGVGRQQSLRRLRRHVSPVTGVIGALHGAGEVAHGLMHTCVATHSFPMVYENIQVLDENLRGRSGGAGFTQEDAEIGALGEAVERISGTWRGEEEITRRASKDELGDAAIDLADCLLYSDVQYASAEDWNSRQTSPRELIPRRLNAAESIDWTPVWSLRTGAMRYLPTAFCYYGHPDALKRFCFSDSNGCAAGASFEEAVLAGLLEVVERDAVAIWWYNRLQRPSVAIDSFDLPFVGRMQEIYWQMGRDLVVLDLTHDCGIPVFVAVSARLGHPREEIMLGFGAHLNPRQALTRALREINQFYPILKNQDAQGMTLYQTANQEALDWFRNATRRDNAYLLPDKSPPRRLADFHDLSLPDVRDEILGCVDSLSALGLDAFVLDQTRPDINIAACRVIVPGMRHFWRRLAAGRLYSVPAALGWAGSWSQEADLNPRSIFF